MKVISTLNVNFETIQFWVTLPKHQAGIGASINYRREVGGHSITVHRHLNQLYPFMKVSILFFINFVQII
jgi:hypothetical protein